MGDRIADRRCRPSKLAACRGETAGLDDAEEDGELIDARQAGSAHFKFLERYLQPFAGILYQHVWLVFRQGN